MAVEDDTDILTRDKLNKARGQSEIGGALMKSGFSLLGAGLAKKTGNPAVADAYSQLGEDITSTLQDMWWRNEYKNFMASEGEQVMQSVQDSYNRYVQMTTMQPIPQTQARIGQPKQVLQTHVLPPEPTANKQ